MCAWHALAHVSSQLTQTGGNGGGVMTETIYGVSDAAITRTEQLERRQFLCDFWRVFKNCQTLEDCVVLVEREWDTQMSSLRMEVTQR